MFEIAIPYYEKVIRANPKHYQGHYWLAMCFWKLQRYHAAINTLEEVIHFLPTFKDALNLMGECYEQIGEAAKAERCYLKAISTDPDGIVIHGGDFRQRGPRKEGGGETKALDEGSRRVSGRRKEESLEQKIQREWKSIKCPGRGDKTASHGRMGHCFTERPNPQEKFTADRLSPPSVDRIWRRGL